MTDRPTIPIGRVVGDATVRCNKCGREWPYPPAEALDAGAFECECGSGSVTVTGAGAFTGPRGGISIKL